MDAEKVICCEGGCNNNGLLEAAMLGNGNGFGGNNAMWVLFLLLLGGRGWNGYGNNGLSTEFSVLQNQAQDNQNATLLREGMRDNYSALQVLSQNLNCDFNTLQQCCCDLKSAVAQVAGQVGFSAERVINAANLGDMNIIQQLKDCCCTTQKSILEQGYQSQLAICNQTSELRNGQRDLGQAITQGFSQTAYQAQQDKCDIIRAGQDNTQRIIDTLNSHWKDEQANEIQDLKFQLSQERQNNYIARVISGNGCGCNNGCGNGVGY